MSSEPVDVEAIVQMLRSALIDAGREAGAILADNVSNEFLCYVPGEVKGRILKLERRADTAEKALAEAREEAVRETVEKCAKVADEFPEEMLFMWERPGGPPGNGYGPSKPKHVATAIRALAPPRTSVPDTDEA